MINNIPNDLNIETLLSYLPEGSYKVVFNGPHKRNSYNDLIGLAEDANQKLKLTVGKPSLYNVLPEYMFHPIDRFDDIPKDDDKELFEQEMAAEEEKTAAARDFFAPFDLWLLHLKMEIHEKLRSFTENDKIMIDIIGDRLTEKQRQNRFIKHVLPFLPSCRNIRGNKTLLTLLMRKIFIEEDLNIQVAEKKQEFIDQKPRYNDHIDAELNELYVGNTYYEPVTTYLIHYWSDEECNENFLSFIDDLEVLRSFLQDYFIALDEMLCFEIQTDDAPLRLSDPIKYNYLNYNTNL